jgi:hypothetical protein
MWTEFPHVIRRDTLAWKTFEEVWIHISIPFHSIPQIRLLLRSVRSMLTCHATVIHLSHYLLFCTKKHPLQVNLRVKNKKPSNEAWYWYKKGKEQEQVQSASWGITVSIRSVPLNKRSVHSVADAP